ncbi:MAG TPA: class I SAM-dependent methyltransferase [Phototrophicaceae bacterium]|jgi:SAM-dependent methyltransferase|nr:class I SAM-dependent methyltransferase [Phototrophicaceae bacterium]
MSDAEDPVRRSIRESLAKGDATGWFEQIYARADSGEGVIPWARYAPAPELTHWLSTHKPATENKRALVVGCGTGDDAEALAGAGFQVTAFDIAETAIAMCKQRFPKSRVDYQVADLFQLPPTWAQSSDLVLESRTIQALPWQYSDLAMAAIATQVVPGGMLLVFCLGREPEEDRRGIPWALSRDELADFLKYGLVEQQFEEYSEGSGRRFCVEYRRVAV